MHKMLLPVVCLLFGAAQSSAQNFVTAKGDKLMDGQTELRFISFNIPNLHYVEDDLRFDKPNPWRVANEFEIRDGLLAIRQMGGNVTRIYTPSIRKAIDDSSIVRHVYGPGRFDEEAFKAYDKVLQVANQTGVRVIIPLVDNWWWWGGPAEYARFRGKSKAEFWTDSLLIADFKKTVAFLVTRVNSYTGIPYREDRAILGWETGNELEAPFSWTREIAAFIKSLDSNHLVIEGTHSKEISDAALEDSNIDVLSTHHYSPRDETIARILAARERSKGRKPYFVGEFGFIPTADMRCILDTVISSGVSGIMVWSLRTHNRDGGFYFHGVVYRWPGFSSGNSWDETAVVRLFREKAFQIMNRDPDPLTAPQPPVVLPLSDPYSISWQGSTGAISYQIERKAEDDMLWTAIATNVSDAEIGYRPLFADTSAVPGVWYRYRVRARGLAGYSEPSEASPPAAAAHRLLVDELADASKLFARSDSVKFVSLADAARAKEDRGRIAGTASDYITYKLPERSVAVRVDAYLTTADTAGSIRLLTGTDSLTVLTTTKKVFTPLKNEYRMYTPVRYIAAGIPAGHRYLRVYLAPGIQVGRVELVYDATPASRGSIETNK